MEPFPVVSVTTLEGTSAKPGCCDRVSPTWSEVFLHCILHKLITSWIDTSQLRCSEGETWNCESAHAVQHVHATSFWSGAIDCSATQHCLRTSYEWVEAAWQILKEEGRRRCKAAGGAVASD